LVKIAVDAGHGFNTSGKRTPDGEREWTFNSKVASAAIAKLNTFQNVEILRLDDSTGKTDVALGTRTSRANTWRADVLVSIHHNAHLGKWGTHGGVETYTQPGSSEISLDIAGIVHPEVVKAMGLRDRGRKTLNLHMLRESSMPAILIEGGFMDSTVDIIAIRDEQKLQAQGEAIAEGLAVYFKLKPKTGQSNSTKTMVYKYGDTEPAIGKLQKDFIELGYKLVVDNSFGPAMLAVVKSFQKNYGLAMDGYVGPETQGKMKELLNANPKDEAAVYRIIIDGKQVGAYADPSNVTEEVRKAMSNNAKNIEIQRV